LYFLKTPIDFVALDQGCSPDSPIPGPATGSWSDEDAYSEGLSSYTWAHPRPSAKGFLCSTSLSLMCGIGSVRRWPNCRVKYCRGSSRHYSYWSDCMGCPRSEPNCYSIWFGLLPVGPVGLVLITRGRGTVRTHPLDPMVARIWNAAPAPFHELNYGQ
jgi:hypothetical protein